MQRIPEVPKRASELTAREVAELVGRPDPFIIEVGCNDGETTEQFVAEMPEALILCFECEGRAIEAFRLKDDLRVTLILNAIANYVGVATFFPSDGKFPQMPEHKDSWDYSGSLRKPTGHLERDKLVTFGEPVEVPTTTLDHYYSDTTVDFLWADVQGAEALMILGARKTLQRTRWLYTEFYDVPQYDRQPDLYGLYCFLPDFDLVGIYGDNALFKHRNLVHAE